jgi:hypothetical protein
MPTWSLPCSLVDLLAGFHPCFTTPTFRVFQAMVCGLLVQPGRRTVTGMLAGARLAGVWHHARAHRFFAAARWSADALGLQVCDLIVGWLGDPAAPICLVVDDSLFKRTGRKIFGAAWHYDAAATGRKRTRVGQQLGRGRRGGGVAVCGPPAGVPAGLVPLVAAPPARPFKARPGLRAGRAGVRPLPTTRSI